MKIVVSIIIILSLYSCVSKNILTYAKKPFYEEINSYQLYSNLVILRQSINYDNPNSQDKRFAFGATIMVKEKTLIAGKRLFDIVADSVYYFHQLPRISLSDSRSYYKLVGKVEFLEWDSVHVVLKEHINVVDSLSKVVKKYRGKTEFKKDTHDFKFYFD